MEATLVPREYSADFTLSLNDIGQLLPRHVILVGKFVAAPPDRRTTEK
jgi:hypothetical protein